MRRVAPEEPVKMEVVVKGEEPLHYQWETFENSNGAATPIEGCNEPFLTVALEASDTMLAFQCRVSNAAWPQGLVSRTFFLKKAARSTPTTENAPQQANRAAPQPSSRR
jgi:hypothetical protein